MNALELKELATNALTGHWPPHLGVRTDAEKIEYLAWKLEDAAINSIDAANNEIERLESQLDDASNEICDLERENDQLEQRVADLEKDKT